MVNTDKIVNLWENGVLCMKYFTYGYEDYNGNNGEITVKANTKEESWNRIHDYEVSKGELHYAWFKSEKLRSISGTLSALNPKKVANGISCPSFFIGLLHLGHILSGRSNPLE